VATSVRRTMQDPASQGATGRVVQGMALFSLPARDRASLDGATRRSPAVSASARSASRARHFFSSLPHASQNEPATSPQPAQLRPFLQTVLFGLLTRRELGYLPWALFCRTPFVRSPRLASDMSEPHRNSTMRMMLDGGSKVHDPILSLASSSCRNDQMHHIRSLALASMSNPLASRNVARVFPEVVPVTVNPRLPKPATFHCTSDLGRHAIPQWLHLDCVKRRWKETLLVSDLYKVMAGLIW